MSTDSVVNTCKCQCILWLTSLLLAVNSVHKILNVSFSLELRKVAATFTVCLSVCGMNFKKKAKWLLTAVVFMALCFVLFHPALLHNFLSNTILDFMFEKRTKGRWYLLTAIYCSASALLYLYYNGKNLFRFRLDLCGEVLLYLQALAEIFWNISFSVATKTGKK